MKKLERAIWRPVWLQVFWGQLFEDVGGQDMIEYALLAAAVAVASAAVLPGANGAISTVFSKVGSVLIVAAGS